MREKEIFTKYLKDYLETENLVKKIKLEPITKNLDIQNGQLYSLFNLYYVILDASEYPIEIVIASPYWQLATTKDLVIKFKSRKWVLTSIIRYTSDLIISNSKQLGNIDLQDLKLIYDLVNEGKQLPSKRNGVSELIQGYRYLFRRLEVDRSTYLNDFSFED